MIIQMDTREQKGKKDHILDYFKANGIEVVRSKNYVGDYTLVTNHMVSVDTKFGCAEVYSNLIGKDHERFRDECARAQTCEIKLIVLVEENGITCLAEPAPHRMVSAERRAQSGKMSEPRPVEATASVERIPYEVHAHHVGALRS